MAEPLTIYVVVQGNATVVSTRPSLRLAELDLADFERGHASFGPYRIEEMVPAEAVRELVAAAQQTHCCATMQDDGSCGGCPISVALADLPAVLREA